MGQSGVAAEGGPGGLFNFIPFILMFVIFYFLLIRPQQKKAKMHTQMVENLKKGDKIITSGGIYGKIISLEETALVIEIADKIHIKILRNNVAVKE
jgi:preprotein translocase subunit YajC